MQVPAAMRLAGGLMLALGGFGMLMPQLFSSLVIDDQVVLASGFIFVAGSVFVTGGTLARKLSDLLGAAGVGD